MASQTYTVSLDQTLRELQQQVRQHEEELERVCVYTKSKVLTYNNLRIASFK
jgi:hypothetical protein